MFVGLSRIGVFFAGAALFGTLALPVLAADYHGHGGPVFYRGMHASGFGNRVAEGRNSNFHDRLPRQGNDRSRFERRGFGDDGFDRRMMAQGGRRHDTRGNPFDQDDNNGHFHANHPRVLASRDFSMRRGSGVSVIERNQPDYDFISNYAGSSDVYHANGGTYVTSDGDGGYGYDASSAPTMQPRAKIIDVAKMRDACAHENGVCVIRP